MAKYSLIALMLLTFLACKEKPAAPATAQNPPTFQKSDLQKLRWIEGNWKSEVSGPGFYQAYYFPSDSTLEIVSYEFDGKDSSATSIATVYWKNGHLYFGPNGEWVNVLLDDKSCLFNPIREGWHSISWTKNSYDEWTVVHKKPEFVRTIKMKRQPPLAELLKQ